MLFKYFVCKTDPIVTWKNITKHEKDTHLQYFFLTTKTRQRTVLRPGLCISKRHF